MIQSLTKTIAVSVCSTILATVAVSAFDVREHIASTLLAGLFGVGQEEHVGPCPKNMVLVTQALVPFCVDMYEASPSEDCSSVDPASAEETTLDLARPSCKAVSLPNRVPWRYISQTQAQAACSRSEKRLLTASEWYKASLGTPDPSRAWGEDDCNVANNVEDGVAQTGHAMHCVSDAGAYDMVGNVWEWVESSVDHGVWEGRTLPSSGFVAGIDVDGIAFKSSSAQQDLYNHDRLWSDSSMFAGVMRGGYFASKDQAGVFATYAASPPTFTGDATGFRCAMTPVS